MKSMTCRQLGGACDHVFQANTFDEMAKMSKAHGMEMFQKNDAPHLAAMNKMRELMKAPGDMEVWYDARRAEFDALPED